MIFLTAIIILELNYYALWFSIFLPLQSFTLLYYHLLFNFFKYSPRERETINIYVKVSVHVCTQCPMSALEKDSSSNILIGKFCWTFRYKLLLRTVQSLVLCPLPTWISSSCFIDFVEVKIIFISFFLHVHLHVKQSHTTMRKEEKAYQHSDFPSWQRSNGLISLTLIFVILKSVYL